MLSNAGKTKGTVHLEAPEDKPDDNADSVLSPTTTLFAQTTQHRRLGTNLHYLHPLPTFTTPFFRPLALPHVWLLRSPLRDRLPLPSSSQLAAYLRSPNGERGLTTETGAGLSCMER